MWTHEFRAAYYSMCLVLFLHQRIPNSKPDLSFAWQGQVLAILCLWALHGLTKTSCGTQPPDIWSLWCPFFAPKISSKIFLKSWTSQLQATQPTTSNSTTTQRRLSPAGWNRVCKAILLSKQLHNVIPHWSTPSNDSEPALRCIDYWGNTSFNNSLVIEYLLKRRAWAKGPCLSEMALMIFEGPNKGRPEGTWSNLAISYWVLTGFGLYGGVPLSYAKAGLTWSHYRMNKFAESQAHKHREWLYMA